MGSTGAKRVGGLMNNVPPAETEPNLATESGMARLVYGRPFRELSEDEKNDVTNAVIAYKNREEAGIITRDVEAVEVTPPGFSTPLYYIRYAKSWYDSGDDKFYPSESGGIRGEFDFDGRSLTASELNNAITSSGGAVRTYNYTELVEARRGASASTTTATTTREDRRLARASARTRRAARTSRPSGSR